MDLKHLENEESRIFDRQRKIDYAKRREEMRITYGPFEDRLEHYKFLASLPPQRRECVTPIIGPAGSGKTRLIQNYLKRYPPEWVDGNYCVPAIHLTMTHFNRVEEVSPALLAALELPDAYNEPGHKIKYTHAERMSRFHSVAPSMGLRLIFLDEFHDCVKLDGRGEPFLRLLKSMILHGHRVIPAGTEALVPFLVRDDQFKSRFDFGEGYMPKVTSRRLVRGCMETISGLPPQDISDAAVALVLKASDGRIGFILEIIEKTLRKYSNLNVTSLSQRIRDMRLIQ